MMNTDRAFGPDRNGPLADPGDGDPETGSWLLL